MSYRRILGVWLVLAGLMICNGVLRVAFLRWLMPRGAAEVTSVILGMAIVIAASRPFLVDQPSQTTAQVYRVSGIWLVLTVAFEAGLGRMAGQSWSEMAAQYAVWNGATWPLVLVAVVAAPFIWLQRPLRAVPKPVP